MKEVERLKAELLSQKAESAMMMESLQSRIQQLEMELSEMKQIAESTSQVRLAGNVRSWNSLSFIILNLKSGGVKDVFVSHIAYDFLNEYLVEYFMVKYFMV